MERSGRVTSGAIGRLTCGVVVLAAVVLAPSVGAVDQLGAGDGSIYRLTPESSFQEGCFPPCMCPIMIREGVRGTFNLRYTGLDGVLETYAVDDVNWTVPGDPGPMRIIGSGTYAIGSPNPITVIQHRMELDLQVGDEPVQHFDSGWVALGSWSSVNIAVSLNGMYCWDTAIFIDALPVPADQVQPYALAAGSTFQRGCWDPCDCPLGPEQLLVGTFDLVLLEESLFLTEFAVVNADWEVVADPARDGIPIGGYGVYQLLGDFVLQQRLGLELVVGEEPSTHFDSGPFLGDEVFPTIDAVVSVNGVECFDTVLHVIAVPFAAEVCGGWAGITCRDGEFCKLPLGSCCCDFFGECTPIPTGCADVWDPVCGCHGMTHGNECEAEALGVSIAHLGECGVDQACCFPDGSCSEMNPLYCAYSDGTPLGSGSTCGDPGFAACEGGIFSDGFESGDSFAWPAEAP